MYNLKQKGISILKFPFLLIMLSYVSCNGQNKPVSIGSHGMETTEVPESEFNSGFLITNKATGIDQNIRSIFQDSHRNYWFGTNGVGVYRWDGKNLIQFTEKDGLSNNQVQSIQEDQSGNLWFGTGMFGVSRFDGKGFTTFSSKERLQASDHSGKKWALAPDDLWFYAGGGVYRYNKDSFVYLTLGKEPVAAEGMQSSPYTLSRYAVYCILKDREGNLWLGTQADGVCRYDGKTFTWFTDQGLAGPAVLGLFEDSKGNIWFGNNGSGLFRYDGTALINFTEEKGLSNPEFRLSGKDGPNTLARVYSINEDRNGNLWIGTVDAGVWRYDGTNLTQYTTRDGLTSNAVNTIYKDHLGDLWFGTDADGVCKFNGRSFEQFTTQ